MFFNKYIYLLRQSFINTNHFLLENIVLFFEVSYTKHVQLVVPLVSLNDKMHAYF